MAFDTVINEASSRRNTSPTSSTLRFVTEDIDCSGMAAPPEDGEFIVCVAGSADESDAILGGGTVAACDIVGSGLRMVWGSALRSDRSALGDSRVPVIMRGGGRFKTKFFLTDANESPTTAGYVPGALLTVGRPAAAHRGSANRQILVRALAADTGAAAWVVGHVVRVINDSQVSGTKEIEIELYSEPRATLLPAE